MRAWLASVSALSLLLLTFACSSSDSSGPPSPPASTPPSGVTFIGGTFNGPCTDRVYTPAGTGYAFCNNNLWAYTTVDPSTDQYGLLVVESDGGTTDPCSAPCSCGACSSGGQGQGH